MNTAVEHQGGTHAYFVPELFRHDRFTRECDVYSMGVNLLEFITLLKPQVAAVDFNKNRCIRKFQLG